MALDPNDDIGDFNSEPTDEKTDFLAEMTELFEMDPDEAIERLEDAGYSVDDLEL